MNIWLPIVTNVILAVIALSGIIGRKQGWALNFTRLICFVGACIGMWYLTPTVANALMGLSFIAPVEDMLPFYDSIIFTSLCLICFALISLVCHLIYKDVIVIKRINFAKVKRAKGIDKKADREIRKEERKARQIEKELKQRSKCSKVFGAILNIISTIIISILIYCLMKYGFTYFSQYNENLVSGYESTLYYQISKMI